MAVTNANYFAMFPLQETIWAKDGTGPLDSGIVRFYSDPSFVTPKNVYEQSNQAPYSFVNVGSELTLSGIGSFVDPSGENFIPMLYPYTGLPTDTNAPGDYEPYFIRVYSSGGILEFSVTNWPPNNYAISDVTTSTGITTNQITNPQFSEMSFTGTLSTTLAGGTTLIPFAPGWFLSATGTGLVTLTQESLAIQTPSDAPYSIDINLASGVSAILYQRIYNSPRLFAGEVVSGYFEGASQTGSAIFLTMTYVPSDVLSIPVQVAQGSTAANGDYTSISDSVLLDSVVSVDGATGYVDVQIAIPNGAHVRITSVQLLAVQSTADIPVFEQISTPLQESGLYWYDRSPLMFKPIPSYLVGWDFPLNPCQALGKGSVGPITLGANTSYYAADQTIIFQTVNSAFTTSVNYNGLNITGTLASSGAIIQYIDPSNVIELLTNRMSVYTLIGSSITTTCKAYINLVWTDGTIPSILTPGFGSCVTAITAGVPTLASGWNFVPRSNLGMAEFDLSSNTSLQFSASGFDATADATILTATNMAIVISFDTIPITKGFSFVKASLQIGDIATPPAPQTTDQVLRECQYYYQKSFFTRTVPVQAAGAQTGESYGYLIAQGNGPIIRYSTPLRVAPTSLVTLYNPVNANALIYNFTVGGDYSTTGITASTNTENGFATNGTQVGGSAGDLIGIHWVADSRLGVI